MTQLHETGCIACGVPLTKACAICAREVCYDCARRHPADHSVVVCATCRLDVIANSTVHYSAHELISDGRTACALPTAGAKLITSIWRHHVSCEACKESVYFQRPHFNWPAGRPILQ